ncbi:transcription termination factor 1-like isoform X2 [Poeciliopsis prolifica]|nr:transcription termination factor 1-like isoform X2 [Poeciliopsis prolifica]XP_054895545.1 transcription termination factor 1-like isoform X2 [Poeciliopsis prolifica]XP_054895546.1 transcription termination factor 1-like isoform X2 [Poeciliopsis prolifica]
MAPPGESQRRRRKEEELSIHGKDGETEGQRRKRRRSAGQLEHLDPVSLNPPEEEKQVFLKRKAKKKRVTGEEQEVALPPTADLMQQEKKKKKKRREVEPPAAGDLNTQKKKRKKTEGREEEMICLPPDGPTHDHKKKKKKKMMTSQQEDENHVCISMTTISPGQEEALEAERTNLSNKEKEKKKNKKKKSSGTGSTQKETKKKKNTKPQKKKTERGDLSCRPEEGVDWALVEELQDYLPHIRRKCLNQIKKILRSDLHRFRKFKQEGVPARLGRFSVQENQQIRENISDFLVLTGIGSVEKLLFPQRFVEEQAAIRRLKKQHGFMERIADGIPRPCHQVYLRALKMFDEKNHMGRFSKEELAALIRFHNLYGNNWKLISQKMDRSVYSLQKRFAALAVEQGAWTGEEERRLKLAVRERLASRAGPDGSSLSRNQLSQSLPWGKISQEVGTRSWIQCRGKWFFLLDRRMTFYGNVFNRGAEGYEAKICLISTLYDMSVDDIADVDWEKVAAAVGDVTPWSVQRMFSRLKQRKVPHSHLLSFGEIVDFLYHRVVPVLQKRLRSLDGSAELQDRCSQDRYQLSDIFNSDLEDDSEMDDI